MRTHLPDGAEAEFRYRRAERAGKKQQCRDNEAALAPQGRGDPASHGGADDTTDQRARDGPSGQAGARRLGEPERVDKVGIDRAHRAGYDRGIPAEQQTAQRRDERQPDDERRIELRHQIPPLRP